MRSARAVCSLLVAFASYINVSQSTPTLHEDSALSMRPGEKGEASNNVDIHIKKIRGCR